MIIQECAVRGLTEEVDIGAYTGIQDTFLGFNLSIYEGFQMYSMRYVRTIDTIYFHNSPLDTSEKRDILSIYSLNMKTTYFSVHFPHCPA